MSDDETPRSTHPPQDSVTELPVLPYPHGGHEHATSGFSGTDTSRERAEHDDEEGLTTARQRGILALLRMRAHRGATWKEAARLLDKHHGQVSGALSNLHQGGRIARLTERRDRCRVYVLPEFVAGRPTDGYGSKRSGHRVDVGPVALQAVMLLRELQPMMPQGPRRDRMARVIAEYDDLTS